MREAVRTEAEELPSESRFWISVEECIASRLSKP